MRFTGPGPSSPPSGGGRSRGCANTYHSAMRPRGCTLRTECIFRADSTRSSLFVTNISPRDLEHSRLYTDCHVFEWRRKICSPPSTSRRLVALTRNDQKRIRLEYKQSFSAFGLSFFSPGARQDLPHTASRADMNQRTMSQAEQTKEPPRPLNVIIIGAGISGLTLAIVLRRKGHHVQVRDAYRVDKRSD